MWETKTVTVLLPVILLIAASFCQVQTEKKVAHRSDIKNQRHKKTSTRMIVSKVANLIESLISFRHLISNKELCLKFKFFGNARIVRILLFLPKNSVKAWFFLCKLFVEVWLHWNVLNSKSENKIPLNLIFWKKWLRNLKFLIQILIFFRFLHRSGWYKKRMRGDCNPFLHDVRCNLFNC